MLENTVVKMRCYNTYRVLGPKAAIPVLFIDILKGFTATSLIHLYPELIPNETSAFVIVKALCGALAVVGHLFGFAGFRGQRSRYTFGMVIGLFPQAAGLALLSFILTYLISNYVSLGSILASLTFSWRYFSYLEMNGLQ